MVDWELSEDYNDFQLELEHKVRETTAQDMIRVDLNSESFNRKFDGVLDRIDFNIKKNDSVRKQMKKIHRLLGMGGIENFIDQEDEASDVGIECTGNTPDVSSDSEDSNVSDEESDIDEKPRQRKKHGKLPGTLRFRRNKH